MIYSGLSHEKWWFSMFFVGLPEGTRGFDEKNCDFRQQRLLYCDIGQKQSPIQSAIRLKFNQHTWPIMGLATGEFDWLKILCMFQPKKTSKDFGRSVGCVGRLCKLCTATQQWTIPEMPLPNIYIYNYIYMLPIQMWIWFAIVDGARLIDCSVFAKLSHGFPEWSPELSMDQQVNAQQRKGLYNFISTLDTASFLNYMIID